VQAHTLEAAEALHYRLVLAKALNPKTPLPEKPATMTWYHQLCYDRVLAARREGRNASLPFSFFFFFW
jgi:hypothetical protein